MTKKQEGLSSNECQGTRDCRTTLCELSVSSFENFGSGRGVAVLESVIPACFGGNTFFAAQGLFTLTTARVIASQSR